MQAHHLCHFALASALLAGCATTRVPSADRIVDILNSQDMQAPWRVDSTASRRGKWTLDVYSQPRDLENSICLADRIQLEIERDQVAERSERKAVALSACADVGEAELAEVLGDIDEQELPRLIAAFRVAASGRESADVDLRFESDDLIPLLRAAAGTTPMSIDTASDGSVRLVFLDSPFSTELLGVEMADAGSGRVRILVFRENGPDPVL